MKKRSTNPLVLLPPQLQPSTCDTSDLQYLQVVSIKSQNMPDIHSFYV